MLEDFKPILKNKSFIALWISQITSQLTINVMNFVFLIRLYEQTGSAISISFLWVAYSLPAILIGPFASATVDLVNRKKMLVITNLLQTATVLICGLTHNNNVFILFETVFVYSLLNQFYVPAESASLPSVVKEKGLAQANSLFFLTMQGSLIVGFGVAGIIYGALGFEKTLFLCAFLLFCAFLSTLFLPSLATGNIVPKNFEKAVGGFFIRIIEGYKFIKGERKVLIPFLLLIGFQVSFQVASVSIPSIAKELMHLPLQNAGITILVPAGIGAILAILTLPKLLARSWRKKKVIDNSLIILGSFLFLLTFIIPSFPYIWRVVFTFIVLIAMGTTFVGITIPSQTFLQESTPKELRGRVFGNFWFLVTVASVIPVIFSGTIIEALGIKFLLLTLSLFCLGSYVFSKKFGDKFING
jgi:MFS family permease